MRLELITVWYNEEFLAPFFLNHYSWVDKIHILLDADTNDRTEAIAREYPNVTVEHAHFPDMMDDLLKVEKINEKYKTLTEADYVMVVDSDEFIFCNRIAKPVRQHLARTQKDVYFVNLWQIYKHETDLALDPEQPIAAQRRHGDPDMEDPTNAMYVKPIVVKGRQELYWGPGNHELTYRGRHLLWTNRNARTFEALNVSVERSEMLQGSHWRLVDLPQTIIRRITNRRERQSRVNLKLGLTAQYHNISEEDIVREYHQNKNRPVVLPEEEFCGHEPFEEVAPVTSLTPASGFYGDEGGWRWMSSTGQLVAPPSPVPSLLKAELACGMLEWYDGRAGEPQPLEVTVAVNGEDRQTLRFDSDMQVLSFEQELPTSEKPVVIELLSNQGYVPAKKRINADQRHLSVRLINPRLDGMNSPLNEEPPAEGAEPETTCGGTCSKHCNCEAAQTTEAVEQEEAGSVDASQTPPEPVQGTCCLGEQEDIEALRTLLKKAEAELAKYLTWCPPGHFFSPVPNLQEVRRQESTIFASPPPSLPGIDLNAAGQLDLLEQFAPFYAEQPFADDKQPGLRYFFNNPNFGHGDALALYSMIRHVRPRRIVEVGSGYSSGVTLDTNDLFFNGSIECTFVEPFPELLQSLAGETPERPLNLITQRLQDAPLSLFETLEAGDILFIDSTHVLKTGSDVNRELFEILPALASGVYIHFHDIFYPFEYPPAWVYQGRAWNECYALRAFLQHNRAFEILLFNDYLRSQHYPLLSITKPLWAKNTGGSLWLKKL